MKLAQHVFHKHAAGESHQLKCFFTILSHHSIKSASLTWRKLTPPRQLLQHLQPCYDQHKPLPMPQHTTQLTDKPFSFMELFGTLASVNTSSSPVPYSISYAQVSQLGEKMKMHFPDVFNATLWKSHLNPS